jgi:integrase
MITLMNDKPAKAAALRLPLTQKLVDSLTYDEALARHRQRARERPLDHPRDEADAPGSLEACPEASADAFAEASAQAKPQARGATSPPPAQPPDSVRVWDQAKPGFGLRLFANGKRQYFVAGRVGNTGTQRYITLSAPSEAYLLKRARKEGASKLQQLRDGVDCSANGKKDQQADDAFTVTLATIFERYVVRNTKPMRSKTRHNYAYALEHYLYQIADKPVASITRAMCEQIYKSISKGTFVPPPSPDDTQDGAPATPRKMRQPAPTTANNVMAMLRAVLEWARKKYRDQKGGYRILGLHPVDAMFEESERNSLEPRDDRVPTEKIGQVYRALRRQSIIGDKPVTRTAADWLQFRLLTPARRTESSQLRFGDIDFVGKVLVLPAQVTKNGYRYRLPLNEPLVELLEHRRDVYLSTHPGVAAPPDQAWVFDSPSNKTGHISGCERTLARISELCGVLVQGHGFRRTFMDVAIECRIGDRTRARLLGHGGGVTQKHYENNPHGLDEPMKLIGAFFLALQAEPPQASSTSNAPQASQASDTPGEAEPLAPTKPAWPREKSPGLQAWHALTSIELIQQVWTKPSAQVARDYGISDCTVGMRCKALGIPKPSRGYWTKVAAGLIDKRLPPLIPPPPPPML